MLISTRGIVFRAVKYGETSVIADIFTEEHGLHSFIAGGVRTARARMPYNLFQPMTAVDLVAYFRPGEGALNRLREMRPALVYTAIPFDIRRGAVTLFMAEICRKCVQETEENRPLFEFLLETLYWLDTTEQPIANMHLHFLVHLSGFLGFLPEEPLVGGELFFDLQDGVFLPVPPPHRHYMEPEASEHLQALLELPLDACHTLSLQRAQRKTLLHHLIQFYQLHLPGFTGVNTPEVLEMVLEG